MTGTGTYVPEPDDPRKPSSIGELTKPSWKYIGRKTVREFTDDQCTDLAAALTYYAVLSLFPALIALTSLLGLVGQTDRTMDTVLDVLDDVTRPATMNVVEPVLLGLADSESAGLTLVIGLLGAIWTASAYVGAFGRAMNRIYEIGEGRPFWKLRPTMILVTVLALALTLMILFILVVSGPIAESIGRVLGIGDTALQAWGVVKWPVLLLMVSMVVALLYYATPNVKQPRLRWVSVGAVVAISVWALASLGFGFYVANFSSYNRTYGSLAGAIVFLLWLWLTNIALLFGAEIDAELERGRQLQAGMAAEEHIQLPPRDTRNIEKSEERQAEDVERGRAIRANVDAARRDFTVPPADEGVAATGESSAFRQDPPRS